MKKFIDLYDADYLLGQLRILYYSAPEVEIPKFLGHRLTHRSQLISEFYNEHVPLVKIVCPSGWVLNVRHHEKSIRELIKRIGGKL